MRRTLGLQRSGRDTRYAFRCLDSRVDRKHAGGTFNTRLSPILSYLRWDVSLHEVALITLILAWERRIYYKQPTVVFAAQIGPAKCKVGFSEAHRNSREPKKRVPEKKNGGRVTA